VPGQGPTTIGGRYELQRPLGAGGMAEVWLALDLRLNRKQVAVKRLHGFRAGGPDADLDLDRARREAFAASRLSHPNLVAVTDFIAEQGEPFIVMEYVEGRTLDELCRGGGLPLHEAAHLMSQVAAALGEAHAAHIVHRDIKPANIIVSSRGDAKLADFGIARAPDDPRYTRTGMFTGTMRYLAPEVLEGRPARSPSDIWALGATLFEAVEGTPAFDAPTNVAIMAAIAMGPVPKITGSSALAGLVARMLDRDPAARPPAEEVAAQLRPLSQPATEVAPVPWDAGLSTAGAGRDVAPGDATVRVAARRPPGPTRPRSRSKKRTRAWMIVAVPAVLAVTGIGIALGASGGGGNQPLAGGDHPSLRSTSHANVGGGPPPGSEPTLHSSSSHPVVGVGDPHSAQPGGSTLHEPTTVRFAGVTVRHATQRKHEPVVTTRGGTPPGTLRVTNLVAGHGAPAGPTSTVVVRYVGVRYADGKVFDSSWPRTASFHLPATVAGFRHGIGGDGQIAKMRVGGRRLIVVPPDQGYGDRSAGTVPSGSTLVYVVDLISVS
jgi:tRNA A-37 threonylcarbamoyl transferase component Bud32